MNITPNERKVLYQSETNSVRRRMQVLNGIWSGKGVKEIGADLGISPKTVEWHRQSLYRLFGVSDQISLCKRAIKRGLIKLGIVFLATVSLGEQGITITNIGTTNGLLSLGITPKGVTNTLERIVIYRDGVAIQTLVIPQPPQEIALEVIQL